MNYMRYKLSVYFIFSLLIYILITLPAIADQPGVNGPFCDDPNQSVEPQVTEPGQLIKFISSGHNRVADFTTGGLVNAPANAQTDMKRGQVSHTAANGQLALERVHAVNENGKNVDYYAASSVCGVYTWYHGWNCSEYGDENNCECVHSVKYQVCSQGGNTIATDVSRSIPTQVPTDIPSLIIPTKITIRRQPTLLPTKHIQSNTTFEFPTVAPIADSGQKHMGKQSYGGFSLPIIDWLTKSIRSNSGIVTQKTTTMGKGIFIEGKLLVEKILSSFFRDTAF